MMNVTCMLLSTILSIDIVAAMAPSHGIEILLLLVSVCQYDGANGSLVNDVI